MIPPFLLSALTNWRVWAALALSASLLATYVQTKRLNASQEATARVEGQFAAFREQVKATGELAAKQAKETEDKYALQTKSAIAARDDAIKRLRESANRPVERLVPGNSGSSVCYDPERLDDALRGFAERTKVILREGEEAALNLRAVVDSWPR